MTALGGARIQPPPRPKVTPGFCSTGRPVCGKPAAFTARGWRCLEHRAPNPPPGPGWPSRRNQT